MISKLELKELEELIILARKYNISTFTYTGKNGSSFSLNGNKDEVIEPVKEKQLTEDDKEEQFFNDLYAAVPGYTRIKRGE